MTSRDRLAVHETTTESTAAPPAEDSRGARFVGGTVPAVDAEATTTGARGSSASERAYGAARHDMHWTDDVGANAIKNAFWKARYNGEVDTIPAAVAELRRRVDASPDAAGLHGNADYWAGVLTVLIWDVKKLHDNAAGAKRSYVDTRKFHQMLAGFPTRQLLWPDEKAFVRDGFDALVAAGAARWNKPIGLAERSADGGGEQRPERRETGERRDGERGDAERGEARASGRLEQIIKVLELVANIPALKPHLELIKSTIEIVHKVESGEATAADYATAVSEIGSALFEELSWLMERITDWDLEAAELFENLSGVADVFGMPAAAIKTVDDVLVLMRGRDLHGNTVSEKDRYLAFFDLGKQAAALTKGAIAIAKVSPKLSAFLAPIGEAMGWANPIAIGATVAYHELEFCYNHVYGVAKERLGKFLTDLRSGGDPKALIAAIEQMPPTRDTLVDLAPVFTGATGEVYSYLYGNAKVFGQGTIGWGWLAAWTRFWDDNIKFGELTQFALPDIAPRHEQYWANMAIVAKRLAIRFIRGEIDSGKVAS